MWVGMYVKITEDAVGRMHWHKVEYPQLEGNGPSDGGGGVEGAQMASRMTERLSSKYLAPSKYLTHIVRWLLASGFTDKKKTHTHTKQTNKKKADLVRLIYSKSPSK